jgi:hypothetical protein
MDDMTQYLMAVGMREDEEPWDPAEMKKSMDAVDALNQTMMDEGVWVFAGGLHPANLATVVREHNGEILVTDGPYVEAKEHIGGFWVIEAPDLDAAIGWASKATVACQRPVEVRPFQDEPPA